MKRERKTIKYQFSTDFTSPKSAHRMGTQAGQKVDRSIQLTTARALDAQLQQYRSM